jgi:hypothetical protein
LFDEHETRSWVDYELNLYLICNTLLTCHEDSKIINILNVENKMSFLMYYFPATKNVCIGVFLKIMFLRKEHNNNTNNNNNKYFCAWKKQNGTKEKNIQEGKFGYIFHGFFKRVTDIEYSLQRWRWSRDSSVGIATGYGLEEGGVGVRVPVGHEFSLPHVVQTGSGGHPTSYKMGTGGSFLRGKAAGA